MSVIRIRRLGLCLLVVVLLLSVTVSAADSVVLMDPVQYSVIYDFLEHISDYITYINTNLIVMIEDNIKGTLVDALFYTNGSVDLSVADLLQNIQVETEFIDSHLASSFEKISSIEDALHMTITSSNGSSITYDMASIVYNHIGDKLDGISSSIDKTNGLVGGTINSPLSNMLRILSTLNSSTNSIKSSLTDIHDFLMNEEDLETKDASKDDQQTFNSEFGSKDRTGDMSKLSGLSTGMTDWFSLPDVDITSMFDQVETGYGKWFTSETAQAISVGGGSAAVAAAAGIAVVSDAEYVEPETPYLDAWDQEVKDILAGGDGEW